MDEPAASEPLIRPTPGRDPVLTRRSIRKYTGEPVADESVERLLRAAMAAPSAGDQRPWQFVVVRDRAMLAAIGAESIEALAGAGIDVR